MARTRLLGRSATAAALVSTGLLALSGTAASADRGDRALASSVTIEGTPRVGELLTLVTTFGEGHSPWALEAFWQSDGPVVGGGSSYRLTPDDLGHQISVTVIITPTPSDPPVGMGGASVGPVQPGLMTPATPEIAGTAALGQTLTVTVGAWKPAGTAVTYQWMRHGVAIDAATSPTYHVAPADVGADLGVRVTGTSRGYETTEVSSAATALVAPGDLLPPTPAIRGRVRVGSTLRAAGRWRPAGVTLRFRWLRNGAPVPRATRAAYHLVRADQGKRISVRVTGRKTGYTTATATSKATAKVKAKPQKRR
ncbi:hypothetical protein [Nocardioides conyzicola]|uniref:Ig-like domain-containing protein n=1 Tax=Nocardioides conyzicola TaxID=1651781 RepID=A0ABP8XSM4_9ACTN